MKAVLMLLLVINFGICMGQQRAEYEPIVGKKVPQFNAKTLKGETFNLADHAGKVIVINFWTLSCSVCFREISDFNRMLIENKDKSFLLVSLTDDSRQELNKLIVEGGEKYKMSRKIADNDRINFEIIPGAKAMMEQFGHKAGFPATFFVDRKGIIRTYSGGYVMSMDGEKNYQMLKEKLQKVIE